MPLYDLKCTNCGHEFEDLVASRNAVADVVCEKCGEKGLELKPSLFASSVAGSSVGSSSGGACGPGPFR